MSTIKNKKIEGTTVRVEIVPKGNFKVRPQYRMNPTSITVHTTGNKAKTANGDAHKRLLHRSATDPFAPYISYHFVVDDKEIIQLLPWNESSWSNGDGSGINSGNRTSISIEICENADGNFSKAEQNAKKLIRYLMKECDIPLSKVVPHEHWSGKNCPKPILERKGGWKSFHSKILDTVETASAPLTFSSNLQTYTVKKDDTLWGISQKFNTTISKIKKDNGLKDDLINPGDELMVKAPEKENEFEGKRVESIVDSLRYYNKPSWKDEDAFGELKKGHGFEIVDKIKVGNGYQYKVKNSKGVIYYVTASEKYVKVL